MVGQTHRHLRTHRRKVQSHRRRGLLHSERIADLLPERLLFDEGSDRNEGAQVVKVVSAMGAPGGTGVRASRLLPNR